MRAFVLLVVCLCACSKGASNEIRSGRWSGSTSGDVAVTIDVGGSNVEVDGREAKLDSPDDNTNFRAEKSKGKPHFDCTPAPGNDEMTCEVKWPDRTDRIDFMRE